MALVLGRASQRVDGCCCDRVQAALQRQHVVDDSGALGAAPRRAAEDAARARVLLYLQRCPSAHKMSR